MLIPQDEQESYNRDYARMCRADDYDLKDAAEHFIKAGKQEMLYALLVKNKAWMDAKMKRFRSAQFFISDVKLALNTNLEPLQLIELEAVHRVAEYSVSIYRDTEVETLIWLGDLQEALEVIRAYPNARSRVAGLLIIERTIRESQTPLETNILLAEIEKEIAGITDPIQRQWSLTNLAEAYATNQMFDKALDLCYSIEHQLIQIAGLGNVGMLLHKAGDSRSAEIFRQVQQVAQELPIEDISGQRFPTQYELVKALAETWEISKAAYWAGVIAYDPFDLDDSKEFAINAYVVIVKQLVREAYLGAGDYVDEALGLAFQLKDVTIQVRSLAHIASALFVPQGDVPAYRAEGYAEWIQRQGIQLFTQAESLWEQKLTNKQKPKAAIYLIDNFVSAGLFDQAERVCATLLEPELSFARLLIAYGLGKRGRFEEAERMCRNIHHADQRVQALSSLALELAKSKHLQARTLFDEVIITRRAPLVDQSRFAALCMISSFFLSHQSLVNLILVFSQIIENVANIDSEFSGLLIHCVRLAREHNMTLDVNEIIALVKQPAVKIDLYCAFLDWEEARKLERFHQALELAQSAVDELMKARYLATIALAGQINDLDTDAIFDESQQIINEYLRGLDITDELLDVEPAVKMMKGVYAKFRLVECLLEAKRFDQAIKLAGTIRYNSDKAAMMIIQSLCAVGELNKASEVVYISDAWIWKKTVPILFRYIFDLRDTNRALHELEILQAHAEPSLSAEMAWSVIEFLFQTQDERAEALIQPTIDLIEFISDSEVRAEALCIGARALYRTNHRQATILIEQAEHLIQPLLSTVSNSHRPGITSEMLMKYADLLITLGRIDDAYKIARIIPDDNALLGGTIRVNHNRNTILSKIAEYYIQLGNYAQAKQLSSEIIDDSALQGNIRQSITRAHLHNKNLAAAFDETHFSSQSAYIAFLTVWEKYLEAIQPDLTAASIIASLRIAGWIDPHWREIYLGLGIRSGSNG